MVLIAYCTFNDIPLLKTTGNEHFFSHFIADFSLCPWMRVQFLHVCLVNVSVMSLLSHFSSRLWSQFRVGADCVEAQGTPSVDS